MLASVKIVPSVSMERFQKNFEAWCPVSKVIYFYLNNVDQVVSWRKVQEDCKVPEDTDKEDPKCDDDIPLQIMEDILSK